MAVLSLQWAGRLRPLLVAILLPTLALACAGDGRPQYGEETVALQVEEDWEILVEQPTEGFLDTVERNAEDFADTGAKGTAVVGCIAGAVTLVAMTQGQADAAGDVGCMVGGFALYPVGYALGYGTGAAVGTVQGAINLLANSGEEIDTAALLAVIENAKPRVDLATAMIEQSRQLPSASPVWTHGTDESNDDPSQTRPEPALQLTLTITRLWLTTTTGAPPTSRLHLAVEGELTETRTGRELRDGSWRFVSEPLSTAEIADNGADALKSELAGGWRTLASEIIADLFGPDGR
jgi:hypothetical protein